MKRPFFQPLSGPLLNFSPGTHATLIRPCNLVCTNYPPPPRTRTLASRTLFLSTLPQRAPPSPPREKSPGCTSSHRANCSRFSERPDLARTLPDVSTTRFGALQRTRTALARYYSDAHLVMLLSRCLRVAAQKLRGPSWPRAARRCFSSLLTTSLSRPLYPRHTFLPLELTALSPLSPRCCYPSSPSHNPGIKIAKLAARVCSPESRLTRDSRECRFARAPA